MTPPTKKVQPVKPDEEKAESIAGLKQFFDRLS